MVNFEFLKIASQLYKYIVSFQILSAVIPSKAKQKFNNYTYDDPVS